MSEEQTKIRCVQCELVQWANRTHCRRCGGALPEPIVKVVERVVEKVVVRQDAECLRNFEQASSLISAATERLQQPLADQAFPIVSSPAPETGGFPTLEAVERKMILAAYMRSNRKPVEAARLLGIGKTTFYRKLREIRTSNCMTASCGQFGVDPLLNRLQPRFGVAPADQPPGAADLDASIWSPRDSQPQALQSI
ncbi:MAG: helix-turn-helix domain-containing protein [Acidobacteriaceae bacterium]